MQVEKTLECRRKRRRDFVLIECRAAVVPVPSYWAKSLWLRPFQSICSRSGETFSAADCPSPARTASRRRRRISGISCSTIPASSRPGPRRLSRPRRLGWLVRLRRGSLRPRCHRPDLLRCGASSAVLKGSSGQSITEYGQKEKVKWKSPKNSKTIFLK